MTRLDMQGRDTEMDESGNNASEVLDRYAHLFGLKKSGDGYAEAKRVKCPSCNGTGQRLSKKFKFYTCKKCKGHGTLLE